MPEALAFGAPALKEDKPVFFYTKVVYMEVGRPAILKVEGFSRPRMTSLVQGANADTGIIETKNSVYKPHELASRPFFVLN